MENQKTYYDENGDFVYTTKPDNINGIALNERFRYVIVEKFDTHNKVRYFTIITYDYDCNDMQYTHNLTLDEIVKFKNVLFFCDFWLIYNGMGEPLLVHPNHYSY